MRVIAEAGTNHGGDPGVARRLIDVAAEAGADSVKFQIIYPEGLYLRRFYRDGGYVDNEVFAKRQAQMLTDDDYRRLADYCRERGLPMSASVFDERGVRLLEEIDAPYAKIASCDLNNPGLLRRAAALGRKLIVATGMASLGEIEQAVACVVKAGNRDLVLLHCVSEYPAALERMNLSFLTTLRAAFGFPVGLSDHTESSLAAAMAVALGAEWVEKHFTLDRKAEGFDHAYAMEPAAFAGFVRDVRAAAAACGRAPEKLSAAERSVKQRARRGVYAARDLAAGQALAPEDLLVVRPESAFAPGDVDRLLGRRLRAPLRANEPLTPASVSWD